KNSILKKPNKKSTVVNTPFDQSACKHPLIQNVMFDSNLIRSVKWTDIIFKNVSFKNVEIEGTTFKDVKFKNCEFKNVIITNSTMSQKLMNELQKQDVTLEDIDTSI
ncbi:pentapeptide repeat-containing protein, partial [Staphylococcus epidermidis]|uniref:pentapeptide repeat-containing protein n=1 Tax=Staphylococcus epidermidis TaxID=1282 RepID=UPI003748749E